ncbi:hypothetical protein A7K93_01680 [Candidatus Methylacidiphilum fumarolicum]|uniref:hypothetical protein n=1 Tax=Candidatus Methylacidiphilum fumarolicum TaxID=591154 RepID=UPI00031A333F|nr:hypothetical protein [Candidatus Methylacidiphilum fumarolicum]MBW6414090.1 hypothetical protein [Candidatus Methylacidiphilum fumarolicum]TFE66440.1 hypothetical protein A7K73_01650 [Candidatus Methylacidiphilum fumarolicum]TFE75222.1 hypothetical protein A7K93_01680 [Candidatus Methylacidiphilum fumarolicum]TFE76166.1 hypothetical protein A7K72_00495 [Candidatus Methylacidiphilum fumarolicum]TFE77313.1 hypothetical protein A7D33_05765 [Candidatus Methylacidiphilum fumarolicum]
MNADSLSVGRGAQRTLFNHSLLSQLPFLYGLRKYKRKDQRPRWGKPMRPEKTMWRTIPRGEPAAQPEEAQASYGSLAFAT